MGRGHGSSRGSGPSKQGGGGDPTLRGMSPGLAAALAAREKLIRENDYYEMGTVYDTEGNIIFNNDKGKNGSVSLGNDFNDRIITHNHPGYDATRSQGYIKRPDGGGSLSDADIFTAARNNAREIRAVTRNYTYTMRRPEKGWGIDSTNHGRVWTGRKWADNADTKRAKRVYNAVVKQVRAKRDEYYRNYKGDKNVAWRRSQTIIWHQVNREFAKRMGWDYSKTRIN